MQTGSLPTLSRAAMMEPSSQRIRMLCVPSMISCANLMPSAKLDRVSISAATSSVVLTLPPVIESKCP